METTPAPSEVPVNTIVTEVVRELKEEQNQAHGVDTTPQLARIDTVQIRSEEPAAKRMRELPTLLSSPTPEPISVVTPRPLMHPSFLNQLEKITKSPFKTPGPIPTLRFLVSSPTPASTGPDTHDEQEASASGRSVEKEAKATFLTARVTRSASKQTPKASPLPKRPYFSLNKGSSSKKHRR